MEKIASECNAIDISVKPEKFFMYVVLNARYDAFLVSIAVPSTTSEIISGTNEDTNVFLKYFFLLKMTYVQKICHNGFM